MSLEQLQQNYSDATGFVVDRTVNPPKILGQAFLASRNRAVTCASVVYGYAEAPWALAVNFVHPDVVVGVKSIVLHPDFDKKAARAWYLNQTGNPGEQLVLSNDIATLTVDMQMPEMPQDKVAELNRALSLPFSSTGVEASGNIRGAEFLSIMSGILQAHKEGLLTLFDSRNLPLARIQMAPGGIQKVYFKGLLGELAFFELVYRKPAQGYAFQTGDAFNWGNVRDITAPADALVQEAMRRVDELPAMFNYLGGADARYQQRIENYDASSASEGIRWFSERLWACIDGYLTLDKLSERAGVDTYTILQAIREMVNKAQASLINRATPFHGSGALGQPLISHTDFEVNAWDPLQAFFLDPLSGRPVWMQGNFFGVANALQPKNMLHTIALPGALPGALILKDYKLIGIHGGPHTPKAGQPMPPVKVYQMMWMGALLDLSAKKGREADTTGEQGALSGLRSKAIEAEAQAAVAVVPPEKLEKYVCPNCYTTNTQTGPCFNCGTQITAPEPEVEEEVKQPAAAVLQKIQDKTNLTKKQIMMIGGVAVCFILAMPLLFGGGGSTPPPGGTTTSTTTDGVVGHPNSEKAMKLAVDNAGFKATAIPSYWYEDTSDLTKPAASFGMYSEQSNQKILFLVFDDLSPVQNLENFVGLPPFADVFRADKISEVKVDENFQLLGDGSLHWFVGRYICQKPVPGQDPHETILIGAYPSPVHGKSVLLIGRAMFPDKGYDYKTALWLCDQMAADYTARGNKQRLAGTDQGKKLVVPGETNTATQTTDDEKPIATDKQLDEFAKLVEEAIQSKLKVPEDVQDELKKKHPVLLRAVLSVGISDEDGTVNKLEIKDQSEMESLTTALEKAVNAAAPFQDPPRTKNGTIALLVKISADKISVKRP